MKYFTKTPGIGGRLRQRIEDFKVEEIAEDVPENENGNYTLFWVEKFNWDTNKLLKEIAKKLHISSKRIGFAGTKDKRAITKQRFCVHDVDPEDIRKISIKDVKITDIKKISKRIYLGDLIGNKFVITIRDINLSKNEIKKRVEGLQKELKKGVPNLFGPQRFGDVRPLTHLIGFEIMKGNFENASKIYLCKIFDREPADSRKAREFLLKNWGKEEAYRKALEIYPSRLRYERAMLDYLSKHPKDFAGAIRRFPQNLRKMFLNAVQAVIFNEVFEIIQVKKGNKIPLVGYDTKLKKGDKIHEAVLQVMKKYGIKQEDFLMKSMPELAVDGNERDAILYPKNFKIIEISEDEFNPGKMKLVISFELPKGSYATVITREVMKND